MNAWLKFPSWIEASGLPAALNAQAKAPFAWAVFRRLIEQDLLVNVSGPSTVEISVATLARLVGTEGKQVHKAVAGMRKAGLVKAFIPDSDDEEALFGLVLPLAVPVTADDLRIDRPELFDGIGWPVRYAVAIEEGAEDQAQPKIRRVVDLYLSQISMKMNALILEELQLIASGYELRLIERVFGLAESRGARSLGWIMSELRREAKIKAKADELRNSGGVTG